MTGETVDVSVKGQVVTMQALDLNGSTVVIRGRWLRVAAIHDEDWVEAEPRALVSALAQLKARPDGPGADLFTFAQKLPDTTPQHAFPMVLESVAAIRLSGYEAWLTRLSRDARADVRKADKRGVVVRESPFDDDLVNGIRAIYNESPIRQDRHFWHYGKAFEAVKRENAPYLRRSVFLGAYAANELIGFLKVVRVGSLGVMMQFLSKISHHDRRASNALIAGAVDHCSRHGMSYLIYGKYRYGKQENSLTRFKHRAGFEEFLVPRFYVPLTWKGSICVRAGLHRDLRDAMPAWLTRGVGSLKGVYLRYRASQRAGGAQGW